MSDVKKALKGRASVLERTRQFESLAHADDDTADDGEKQAQSDSDDEGIDFADLVRSLTSENQETAGVSENDALQEAFKIKILDYDEDGYISVSDLRNALKMFENDDNEDETTIEEQDNEGPDAETLNEMIAEADFDGDGQISFDDFLKVLVKPDETEEPEVDIPPVQNDKKKKKKKHRK